MSDSCTISNSDLLVLLGNRYSKPTLTGNELNDNTANLSNKLAMFGDGIGLIFQKFKVQEQRINDLEKKLD